MVTCLPGGAAQQELRLLGRASERRISQVFFHDVYRFLQRRFDLAFPATVDPDRDFVGVDRVLDVLVFLELARESAHCQG